jgi:hypothetical protein
MSKVDFFAAAFAVAVISLGILLFMSVGILANGWAFMLLWNWFMVPFFGLPEIGLAYALGVSMTVGFIAHQYVPPKKTKEGEVDWAPIVHIFAKPVLAVVLGSIIKSFI